MLVVDVELDRAGRGQQFFVVQQFVPVQIVGDVALAVVHQHQMPEPLERRQQRREQAEQRAVDEDHLVVGMVDDVGELLGEEPDVQRVQDPTGARCGEVQLEMARRVPRERRHTTVGGDPQVVEHPTEPAGPSRPVGIRRALTTGTGRRDDRLVAEVLLGAVEQDAE